jgi:hypothetical protein
MSIIQHVRRQLDCYLNRHPDDADRLTALRTQIACRPESILSRSCMEGHVTSSGLVLSPDLAETLLVWHIGLQRWLQPGGHYEPPGKLVWNAIQETEQEAGLTGVVPYGEGEPTPIDIDTHPIPARPSRGEGAHFHHDFLYLLVARTRDVVIKEDEVSDYRWVDLRQVVSDGDRLGRTAGRAIEAIGAGASS